MLLMMPNISRLPFSSPSARFQRNFSIPAGQRCLKIEPRYTGRTIQAKINPAQTTPGFISRSGVATRIESCFEQNIIAAAFCPYYTRPGVVMCRVFHEIACLFILWMCFWMDKTAWEASPCRYGEVSEWRDLLCSERGTWTYHWIWISQWGGICPPICRTSNYL